MTHKHSTYDLLSEHIGQTLDANLIEKISKQLFADVKSSMLGIFNNSFHSGMIATYLDGSRMPLYAVNDSLLRLLGYDRDEFCSRLGDDVSSIIHPEHRNDPELVAMLTGNGVGRVKMRLLHKNGSSLWVYEQISRGVDEHGKALILGVFIDISELVELHQEMELKTMALEVSEQRFRIALERTSNVILEYDVLRREVSHTDSAGCGNDFTIGLDELEVSLIDGYRIDSSHLGGLVQAFEDINAGVGNTECVIEAHDESDNEMWCKLSLVAINDQNGQPVRAVGVLEDITRQKEAEMSYAREEKYRQALVADSLGVFLINLTRGIFESCELYSTNLLETLPGTPYESMMSFVALSKMDESDQRSFIDMFSRNNILDRYAAGISELKLDYKTYNSDGTSMWLRNTMHVMHDPVSNEMMGFLYVNDIDKAKRDELELMRRSERDPMTGVYNRSTCELFIRQRLQTLDAMQTGVFMMIDVDNFKSINDTYGHPFGDKTLVDAVSVITSTFRDGDIIGRLGGDEFCVFFTGMRSRKRVELSAIAICDGIKKIFDPQSGGPGVSCSIGIAMCAGTLKSFEDLYHEADEALYTAKNRGRNCYAFGSHYKMISPNR